MLEGLCAHSRLAALLVGPDGRVHWTSSFAANELGSLQVGRNFLEALNEVTRLEPAPGDTLAPAVPVAIAPAPAPQSNASPPGDLRVSHRGVSYRHSAVTLDGAASQWTLHWLLDVTHERRLEEHFLQNLHQLQSMKEIVDILYESLSTPEVVYLCLIAVTAQMGFGFNRAFFLQVSGRRLRGRFGIGPSNPEEANAIWSHFAALNFRSLREVYQNFTRSGGVPDPHTQEIALRLEFDLKSLGWDGLTSHEVPGILGALARGKPARLHASDLGSEVDRTLFSLLSTDAVAVVPLLVRGELAGVIIADNLITRKPITEADLNVLKTFAGYAGVALERSHLHDELRDHVAKLQAANDTLKSSQQRLLQVEKLSAIGEMAARVSHEIRNPLVAVGGLARSLLKDQHDAETVETLQIIVTEATRLEKFLRETLDFVKPQAVGRVLIDLRAVVRECLATFKNQIAENGIDIDTRLGGDAVQCPTDPDLLRHALFNLVKNAIEAMETGGRLLVTVGRNGVSGTIRVGDTGPGIPPEVRARIFDPFFTTKPSGTGLGLSVASQNIRGLGGLLELETDPEYRTVFRLTLPIPVIEDHSLAQN